MAKLARKLLTLFGGSGPTSSFGQFGSQVAGAPVFTKDILTIQALTAWVNGLQDAVYGSNKAPFLEDINALHYVHAYQAAYGLQEGVPEHDSTTTYYIGSIVKKTGTSELYMSLTDSNLGNSLPSKVDNTNWRYIVQRGLLQYDSAQTYSAGETVLKPLTGEIYKSLINSNVGNPLPNKVSSAIWSYLVDLADLAPPPAGIQSMKFGFKYVTVNSTSTTTGTATATPLTDFGFDADMVVYGVSILQGTDVNFNQGAAGGFNVEYAWRAYLSGSGVDASGNFLNGGSPATTYTLNLKLDVNSSIGQGFVTGRALAIFIGIK